MKASSLKTEKRGYTEIKFSNLKKTPAHEEHKNPS